MDVLDAFVASCNIGECGCGDSFASRITGVELYDELGRRRVGISRGSPTWAGTPRGHKTRTR